MKMFKSEMFKSLNSMEKIKSPGNDGLSQKILWTLLGWDQNSFSASIYRAFLHQALCSSQKQAVIKMLDQ